MDNYRFERECRTQNSECYTILEDSDPIGRLDLHYTFGTVHATLCVNESLTQEMIHDLIELVDDELLDAVGISRDEFIVHVHQGRELGVYSDHEFSEDGNP